MRIRPIKVFKVFKGIKEAMENKGFKVFKAAMRMGLALCGRSKRRPDTLSMKD